MDANEVKTFAEDLVLLMCQKYGKNFWWKPRTWTTRAPRQVDHKNFVQNLGDVVYSLIEFHWCQPEHIPAGIDVVDHCIFDKFFKFGYDSFNVLDYWAQLLSFGLVYHLHGQVGALDYCAEAIEGSIVHFGGTAGFGHENLLNELQHTAARIKNLTPSWNHPNIFNWNIGSEL